MLVISNDEYVENVSERIEDAIDYALLQVYNEIANEYGFRNVDEMSTFDLYFYGDRDYAAKMRDLAIELFEEVGMDVRPDGNGKKEG